MSTNDVTGDALRTRPSSDKYRDGWDAIFNTGAEKSAPELLEDRKDDSENVRTDRTNQKG